MIAMPVAVPVQRATKPGLTELGIIIGNVFITEPGQRHVRLRQSVKQRVTMLLVDRPGPLGRVT